MPTAAPVEANGDTDALVARAYLRDAKGESCRPYTRAAEGRWWWFPHGDGNAPELVPAFSTDWAAAAQLSGYLRRAGWVTEIVLGDTCAVTLRREDGATVRAEAPALPLALCRAALAAAEARQP